MPVDKNCEVESENLSYIHTHTTNTDTQVTPKDVLCVEVMQVANTLMTQTTSDDKITNFIQKFT